MREKQEKGLRFSYKIVLKSRIAILQETVFLRMFVRKGLTFCTDQISTRESRCSFWYNLQSSPSECIARRVAENMLQGATYFAMF